MEKQLLQQRTKQNRLGFSILLKFFQIEGRFPAFHKEVPKIAAEFLADLLSIASELWINYPLKDRTGKLNRPGFTGDSIS